MAGAQNRDSCIPAWRVLHLGSPKLSDRSVRILTFSTLYPSVVRPTHGIFVETRLRKLVESGAITARVVAPRPWFPFASPTFGQNSVFARMPRSETRYGLDI